MLEDGNRIRQVNVEVESSVLLQEKYLGTLG